MKLAVITLDGKSNGDIDLNDDIFGLEPRRDILQRMVRYQLAKRQAGTHKTKSRSEISRTGKKFGRQKGGGGARHGSRRAPIFIGGGQAHGPQPRSHAIDLPKKIRALALRHALSSKVKSGELVIIENTEIPDNKTATIAKIIDSQGWKNVLFVEGIAVNDNFAKAARNLDKVDVLPIQGANVYDILRHRQLVLTKEAVAALEARYNG